MKTRIVNIESHDPLVQAMGKEWSAKEHQEAMAREALALQRARGDRTPTVADWVDTVGDLAREEATNAVLKAAADLARRAADAEANAPQQPRAAKATKGKARKGAPQTASDMAQAPGKHAASGATSGDSAPVPSAPATAATPAAPPAPSLDEILATTPPSATPPPPPPEVARMRKGGRLAPLPSTKAPSAAQKRLLVKGMKPLHVVEAALFSAGKPLSTEEIANETGLDAKSILTAIKELGALYAERDTVLEVGKAGTKWAMQVRSQAAEPAARFAPMEIAPKLLKTLALIAYHQPMKQSDLVDMVGTKAYDHVPELVERGLVRSREEGSTKLLSTTPQFPEYFGLDASNIEEVKTQMGKLVGLPERPAT